MELGELTAERKRYMDRLSHYNCCRIWRFSGSDDWRTTGKCGDYLKERLFDHFGGFTPEISKELGH